MNEWDEYASGWDQNEDARGYSDKAFNSLQKIISEDQSNWKNYRVLDFGAGTGLLTEKMAPLFSEIVAVDTSSKMIEVLLDKNIENVITDTRELTLDRVQNDSLFEKKFDLIVASSACSFLANFKQFLKIVKTILSPSGVFIQWDWEKKSKDQKFSFTPDDILNSYQTVGLKPESVRTAFSVNGPDGDAPVLMGVARV